MRKRLFFYIIGCIGCLALPLSSQAMEAPHWQSYTFVCLTCHAEEYGGYFEGGRDCATCHKNSGSDNYLKENAPARVNHSSTVIGSEKYGDWTMECRDCHNVHSHFSSLSSPDLFECTINGFATVDGVTTISLKTLTILDPDWADPATWGKKTGTDRGLILRWGVFSAEILSATESSITFMNSSGWRFPNGALMQVRYGMYIDEVVKGREVKFSGPKTLAHDDSDIGIDSTPDGICQVCHTKTTHWRNDGTLTNHFSGWDCILCHPHEKGFKAEPPPLKPCE